MKIYLCYLRKSTDVEDKQVLSLEAQRDVISQYAKRHGLKIGKWVEEKCSARKPGRPLFNNVIEELDSGQYAGLISYKADRLTRNYVDLGKLDELLQSGVEIWDTNHGKYSVENDGAFILGLNAALAKRQVDNLSEDVKRGNKKKLERGQPPTYAPVGYKNVTLANKEKSWVPDPEKAHYIRKAYEWYVSGKFSLVGVAEKLNEDGFLSRGGRKMRRSSLSNILKNPAYSGCFLHNGELVQGSYEPLVSKELWSKAQSLLSSRTQRKDKKSKHFFMFKGFLFCSFCGCSITAEKQKGHVYYRCTKSRGRCEQPYIREEELAPQLNSIIDGVTLSEEQVETVREKLVELYEEDIDYHSINSKKLKTELSKLMEQKKKLFKKMMLGEVSSSDEEMFSELREEVEERISLLEEKLRNLKHKSLDWLEKSSNLLKLANQAKNLFETATREQKLELLNYVSSNRVLRGKEVVFEYNKPFILANELKTRKKKQSAFGADRSMWLGGRDSNPDSQDQNLESYH